MNISKRHELVRKLYTFFVCQGKTTQEINDLYLIRFSLQHKIMLNSFFTLTARQFGHRQTQYYSYISPDVFKP